MDGSKSHLIISSIWNYVISIWRGLFIPIIILNSKANIPISKPCLTLPTKPLLRFEQNICGPSCWILFRGCTIYIVMNKFTEIWSHVIVSLGLNWTDSSSLLAHNAPLENNRLWPRFRRDVEKLQYHSILKRHRWISSSWITQRGSILYQQSRHLGTRMYFIRDCSWSKSFFQRL